MRRRVVIVAAIAAALAIGVPAAVAYFSSTQSSPQPISVAAIASPSAYFGTGAAGSRTSSGAIPVSYPANTTANDLLFLVEINSANQNITTPGGWTLLADQATGSPQQFRFTIWWKVAPAAETSVSLSVNTNSTGASAWVTGYRMQSGTPSPATATVRQGVAGATATLTPTPDVTTNASSATAISIVGIRAANTLSLSTTRGFGLSFAGTDSTRALGFADISVPASGTAPPSPTWSQGGTAAQWAWATVAFK